MKLLLSILELIFVFQLCESFSLLPSPKQQVVGHHHRKHAQILNAHNDIKKHSEQPQPPPPSSLDTKKKNQLNRRDAILSSSVVATVSATSLILLQQPRPAVAATTGTENDDNSTASNQLQKSFIQFESSSKPFPLASFGLQIYDDEQAYKLTLTALELGYRNFFASVLAGNQKGFAQAIRDSNVPLQELYICGTVLSNRAKGYQAAYAKTYKGCLENLNIMSKYGNIEKLDMIMLDYPAFDKDSIRGQWDAFQQFQKENSVSDLAVSNFDAQQLDCILVDNENLTTKPVVNQLPYSIANHPKQFMETNTSRGIHVQSWSPLSSTLPKYKDLLATMGMKYEKSAAQVGLRWIVQNGGSYCVQSQKASHFKENLDVFDFTLSEGDMARLDNLEPPRLLS
jgi:diketogulonate reductase-like aldo/keto reductase